MGQKVSRRYDPPDSPRSVGWVTPQQVQLANASNPLSLCCGAALDYVVVEYEQYGHMNADRSNVVLITHALSGDAHAAGWDATTAHTGRTWRDRKPGWWDAVIGPGKPIDTDHWCVICSNVLGGCYGTTGPASINPTTGLAWGMRFPVVTVEDWVQLQARLMDHLQVQRLHAVIGGSLGGQQALEWALAFPERVGRIACLAASPRLSTQGVAFNAVGRHAIMRDPHFNNGDYYTGPGPQDGLASARMLAHITYLSDQGLENKFGRRRRDQQAPGFGFDIEFEVESYLDYQGRSFVERFDANSYCYITRAMDYYDAAQRWGDGDLVTACKRLQSKVLVVGFSSDWLYTPEDCREFAVAMCRAGKLVSYADIESPYGHDAFLVEEAPVGRLLRSFLHAQQGSMP
ncbi:MAG: homoserine O-acetyltransferase [Planctomycetota bacterium]|nr:MAG: homoserine O-acetyltransferase [Planctomycetota bacterium]